MAKQEADVSTTSWAYDNMAHRWILIDTLLGGTEAMRAAGESFLPKYERESNTHWQNRVDRTVLTNFLEITSDHLVGQALKTSPQLDEDVPEDIEALMEDVDGQGTGFAVFARKIFKDGLDKAYTHVLVDMPSPSPNADGSARTLQQDRDDGLRPYWIHIPPENLIFAHSTMVNGKETLTHIRFKEDVVEVQGWEEVTMQRIRVMLRAVDENDNLVTAWQLWELRQIRGKKEEWVQIDAGIMDIDEIPLVTFYTEREGFMIGKPPLTDLAYLNVAHWQSSSDQRNVLTVSRFPMLAASGALSEDEEGNLTVGPHSFLFMPDPQGKFYYVEHTGAAIDAGQRDLEHLEETMASYGSEFMKKRPANEGVTARVLDSAESLSSLQVWVIDFKDALENMLALTSKWLHGDEDGGGSVILDSDEIGLSEADTAHLDALDKARARKEISRKAYLTELQRRKVLSEDFDIDDDEKERDSEAPSDELNMFGPGTESKPGDNVPNPGKKIPKELIEE